jgi:hypothetical protein
MKEKNQPQPVPTGDLPTYFRSNGIAFLEVGCLDLGFGKGKDQYRLYEYPGPADDEIMGLFCEWHTEDYFDVDSGPHVAIGLRGPVADDPHRGRGVAIGILANRVDNPDDPQHPIELFVGCPDPPGGPSFFIEDFTINEGTAPIKEWQFSPGQDLPQLQGNRIYRLDIHVSKDQVWVSVWEVKRTGEDGADDYLFLGHASCSEDGPAYTGNPRSPCPEDPLDRGKGNVFIGTGFSDPETKSRIESIYIAHWKSRP